MLNAGFSTKVIHTDFLKEDVHHALQMPIYSNATFSFNTAQEMEQAFLGRRSDHLYSRISNPTVENFEQRIRAITGAMNVTALSSGMAAVSNVLLTIAQAGDNVITSRHLFGNTYSFFTSTLKSFGIEVRFCDITNNAEVLAQIDSHTVAIFFETITNPQLEVVDITALSTVAKEKNIILIADSTITPPNVFNASAFGVDIEVMSSTKSISGGSTSIGGLIIDYGSFDWSTNTKLAPFAKKFGPHAFNAKLRKEIFRNLGACMSPHTAYLQSLGLETLELRYNKAAENSLIIANHLKSESKITHVNYPGIKENPYYEISNKQFQPYHGAILTFDFASKEESFTFINNLKLIRCATNLFENTTVIIHPASTIYCEYNEASLHEMGVRDTMLRLSVGIEQVEDVLQDITNALK